MLLGWFLKTVSNQSPGYFPMRFKICVGSHPDNIRACIKDKRKQFLDGYRLRKVEDSRKKRIYEGGLDKSECWGRKAEGGSGRNLVYP